MLTVAVVVKLPVTPGAMRTPTVSLEFNVEMVPALVTELLLLIVTAAEFAQRSSA